MYTKQALRELGLDGSELSDAQRKALDEQGYFLVEGVYSQAECREMAEAFDRLTAIERDQGGHEVHVEPGAPRVSNIFNKTAAYDRCLECKPLLAAAAHLLGEFKIHGANLRDPLKGQGHQDLHCDVPKYFPDDWWVANGILLFDDMTLENGPTRLVPGSHLRPPINIPYVNIGDWTPKPLTPEQQALVPKDFAAPYPGEIYVTAPAGSVAVMNSSLWHAGTTNQSGARRRVLHLTYTRRDLPQQLVQRDYLTQELYERLSPAHRFLMDVEPDEAAAALPKKQSAQRAGAKGWWN
jgi:ectoine hydroxylase-related dioxygenase (phytanoyl-CoA dioxygenase family)